MSTHRISRRICNLQYLSEHCLLNPVFEVFSELRISGFRNVLEYSIWWFPEIGVNRGTPKSSTLVGFSLINQPLLGIHFRKPPYVCFRWIRAQIQKITPSEVHIYLHMKIQGNSLDKNGNPKFFDLVPALIGRLGQGPQPGWCPGPEIIEYHSYSYSTNSISNHTISYANI